jgi:hypothetical protein
VEADIGAGLPRTVLVTRLSIRRVMGGASWNAGEPGTAGHPAPAARRRRRGGRASAAVGRVHAARRDSEMLARVVGELEPLPTA